jgi:hypothetical protein
MNLGDPEKVAQQIPASEGCNTMKWKGKFSLPLIKNHTMRIFVVWI